MGIDTRTKSGIAAMRRNSWPELDDGHPVVVGAESVRATGLQADRTQNDKPISAGHANLIISISISTKYKSELSSF
jgi:hypothetical protein